VLVLENVDVSPSRLWNKIIKGKSDFFFAGEAQQIEHEHDDEHEHDSSKLRNPDINYSYLVNSTLAIKEKREAMELAVVRDELIEKPLAIRQLFYCVTAARQRLLAIPSKVGNHFGTREVPVREVVDYLRGEVNAALSELARLPEAVEANWQERLEED